MRIIAAFSRLRLQSRIADDVDIAAGAGAAAIPDPKG
jgi:hypothetical protein